MASSTTPTPPGNRDVAHHKALGDRSYGMAVVGGSVPREGVREGGNRLQVAACWLPAVVRQANLLPGGVLLFAFVVASPR